MQAVLSFLGHHLLVALVLANAAFVFIFLRDQYHVVAMTVLTILIVVVASHLHWVQVRAAYKQHKQNKTLNQHQRQQRQQQQQQATVHQHQEPHADVVQSTPTHNGTAVAHHVQQYEAKVKAHIPEITVTGDAAVDTSSDITPATKQDQRPKGRDDAVAVPKQAIKEIARAEVWRLQRNIVTAIKTQLLEQGTFRYIILQAILVMQLLPPHASSSTSSPDTLATGCTHGYVILDRATPPCLALKAMIPA